MMPAPSNAIDTGRIPVEICCSACALNPTDPPLRFIKWLFPKTFAVSEEEFAVLATEPEINSQGVTWPLATLCYQSRTSAFESEEDLEALLSDARERNRRLGVTGMLVHEGERFYQWLEGPRAALNVLWSSISRDARHEEVELLGEGVTPARLFNDWDLRFVERDARETPSEAAVLEAAPVEAPAPEEAPVLLARLALAGDEAAITDFVRARGTLGEDARTLCRDLFEPAAHQLGDWWCDDSCSSFDITLALGVLQRLVRRLEADRPRPLRIAIEGRRVLVSPPPKEPHLLGTSLVGGLFERAGWSVQAEFPQDDPELMRLVGAHWFDALALTLSDVFTRRERLTALVQTIKDVRAASRNPNMAVIVGGRAFRASPDEPTQQVGADVHYSSAGDAVEDLDFWLFRQRLTADAAAGAARPKQEVALTPLDLVRMIAPALRRKTDRETAH